MTEYRFPFDQPHPITSPYGPRGSGFHGGCDFGWLASEGPSFQVLSTADGFVGVATWAGEGSGNAVYIDHDDGQSRYFHLASMDVFPGQQVQSGQPIAMSGDTGVPGQPHLHLELLDGHGNRYDPMTVLEWPDDKTAGIGPAEPPEPEEIDMRTLTAIDTTACYLWDGAVTHVKTMDEWTALRAVGLPHHEMLQVEIDRIANIYGVPIGGPAAFSHEPPEGVRDTD